MFQKKNKKDEEKLQALPTEVVDEENAEMLEAAEDEADEDKDNKEIIKSLEKENELLRKKLDDALAELEKIKIEQVNRGNAEHSAGDISGSRDLYFSPEAVKGMSQAEIRSNYTKIIESMKHWN